MKTKGLRLYAILALLALVLILCALAQLNANSPLAIHIGQESVDSVNHVLDRSGIPYQLKEDNYGFYELYADEEYNGSVVAWLFTAYDDVDESGRVLAAEHYESDYFDLASLRKRYLGEEVAFTFEPLGVVYASFLERSAVYDQDTSSNDDGIELSGLETALEYYVNKALIDEFASVEGSSLNIFAPFLDDIPVDFHLTILCYPDMEIPDEETIAAFIDERLGFLEVTAAEFEGGEQGNEDYAFYYIEGNLKTSK